MHPGVQSIDHNDSIWQHRLVHRILVSFVAPLEKFFDVSVDGPANN